jgi:hypothetical protein
VLLDADGPDDYERSVRAFQHDHEAPMEEFAGQATYSMIALRAMSRTGQVRLPGR